MIELLKKQILASKFVLPTRTADQKVFVENFKRKLYTSRLIVRVSVYHVIINSKANRQGRYIINENSGFRQLSARPATQIKKIIIN